MKTSKYASRELYGEIVEGPGGNVMPEVLARLVEKQLPGLPAECREVGYRRVAALPGGMDIKDGERSDISLITNDAVDRDKEVIVPGGGDWKDFRKNPVVTFAHRYDELPVGRALWVKRSPEGNGWLAKTQYTTKPETWQGDWFPDAVWHMVKSGDLRGKSIGFLPTEMSAPNEKEIADRPELAGVGMMIRRWLALEYAVAPVQSNPDAYVVAVGKAQDAGIRIPEIILEEAGIYIPVEVPVLSYKQVDEPTPEPAPVPEPEIARKEQKIDRKAIQAAIRSIDMKQLVEETIHRMCGRV